MYFVCWCFILLVLVADGLVLLYNFVGGLCIVFVVLMMGGL